MATIQERVNSILESLRIDEGMLTTAKNKKSILNVTPKYEVSMYSDVKNDRVSAKVIDGANFNIKEGFNLYYSIFDTYVVFAYKDAGDIMYHEGYVYKFKSTEDARVFYDNMADRGDLRILKGTKLVGVCLYSLREKKFMSVLSAVEDLANGYVRDALSALDKYIETNAIPFEVEEVLYEYSVIGTVKLYKRGYNCSLSIKIKTKEPVDRDTFKILTNAVERYKNMGVISGMFNALDKDDYITIHSYLCN